MRAIRQIIMMLFAAMLLAAPAATMAGDHEHTRSGFFVGFGLGSGNAAWDWTDPDTGRNPSENSGILNFRIGGAVRDNLILGLEGTAWAKRWDVQNSSGAALGEITVTFVLTTFGVTFFPGNNGFYLKGGVGVASAVPKIEFGTAPTSETDRGYGLLGALGYEWRLTQKFALAPQVEVAYLGIDGDVFQDVAIVDGSVQMNWYW
jgi:hypothetical protein